MQAITICSQWEIIMTELGSLNKMAGNAHTEVDVSWLVTRRTTYFCRVIISIFKIWKIYWLQIWNLFFVCFCMLFNCENRK